MLRPPITLATYARDTLYLNNKKKSTKKQPNPLKPFKKKQPPPPTFCLYLSLSLYVCYYILSAESLSSLFLINTQHPTLCSPPVLHPPQPKHHMSPHKTINKTQVVPLWTRFLYVLLTFACVVYVFSWISREENTSLLQ